MLTKVRQNIIKTWIAALRSGDFKQTKGTLKSTRRNGNASYCCLGVLVEVCGNKKEKATLLDMLDANKYVAPKGGVGLGHYVKGGQDASAGDLSPTMMTRVGLTPDHCAELIEMNDSQNRRFGTIANFIEKHVLNGEPTREEVEDAKWDAINRAAAEERANSD